MRRTIPAILVSLAAAGCDRTQTVVIDCAAAGEAVDCLVVRTAGDQPFEVCWDVEQPCKRPEKKRKAHICTRFSAFAPADGGAPKADPPGSKGARVERHIAPEEFQSHCEDDGIGGFTPPVRVENVTFQL